MQNLGASVFTSQEYINRNRSDHDYVYDLYKAYLYREPDQGGWDFWTGQVAANGRNAVRAGFDWSFEFNLKVGGTSPYSPLVGTVPRDGWEAIWYDNATNHIAVPGWNYDVAGNQTRVQNGVGWQRFQYDAANRLVRVKADDNVTVLASYTYGDDNQRLVTEESSVRTYYAVDGGSVLAEYTESGGSTTPVWSKSYVYLGARLLSTLTPNGSGGEFVQYHHPDRLGTRLVTNAQDTSSFEQVTLPFGTAQDNESSGATNRRFTSYDRSPATGLDYALNRHYDPQQGRFTQVDPIGMAAASPANPQSLNLYAYCTNDPINQIDPNGLGFLSFLKKAFKWIAIAVAVALIVVAVSMIGQPHVGVWAIVKMFSQAGQLLAGAFGKGKLSLAFGIAAGVAGLIETLQHPDFTMHFFQDQGHALNPGDIPGLTGPCPWGSCTVTIFANYSKWEKVLRSVGNWATGVADEITTVPFANVSLTKWWRHRQGWEGDADEDSTSYKVGGYTGVAFEITIEALTGEAEVKAATKAGGWASSSGRIFGRHKIGLLNRNDILRVGWSWKGSAMKGREVFRIAIGSARKRIHKHITLWPL
jgi:RHS repeat-associated protein